MSAPCPTLKLQGQAITVCLATCSKLVWHGWSYQQQGCCQHIFQVHSCMQATTPSQIYHQQDEDTSREAYYNMAFNFILSSGRLSLYANLIFTLLQYVSQPHIFLWLTWLYPQYYPNLPHENRIFLGQLQGGADKFLA